ncbi:hypothetical protein ACFQ0X_16880 [Streptomyces rectiviolaceus]|uniref:hypothetical protein n=1 Tax=Streptomyces rectiviolaceus TaxID=332591 RepID=UPI003624BAD0
MTPHAHTPPSAGHPPFCVVLGPDQAGKSTALDHLGRSAPQWRLLSVDDARLAPEHTLIGRLRRNVVKDVAPHPDDWSPEFFASLVQTAVVHLRDQLLRDEGSGRPVVVDSYYYKLLAKCRLAGAPDSPLFAWWRTFPGRAAWSTSTYRPRRPGGAAAWGSTSTCSSTTARGPSGTGFAATRPTSPRRCGTRSIPCP